MTQRTHRVLPYLAVAHSALMLGFTLLLVQCHPFYPVQWYIEGI